MNACKVLWNYFEKFKYVVIHLDDFHYIKEIFVILEKLISQSGSGEVIFQISLCSAGSHYNR